MVTRKLYKVGNSVVVALPSYMLERLGLHAGSSVEVWQGFKTNQIWIRPHDPDSHNKIGNMPRQPIPGQSST